MGIRDLPLSLPDFVTKPLRKVNDEQREHLLDPKSSGADWEVIVILVTTAVMLTLQHYYVTSGSGFWLDKMLYFFCPQSQEEGLKSWLQRSENLQLTRLSRWTFGNFVVYVFCPVFVIKVVLRKKISDYGTRLSGAISGWPIYFGMFLVMVPFILLASTREAFQNYYPFYKLGQNEAIWPRFIAWELLYACQFVALEFFFRGFVLNGTRKRFGAYSIFVMTIPYCMIHFGKPMPETFGAIGAGVILGFMSLKTRSIWLGAAVHISVAWTMDALAVWANFVPSG